MNPFWVRFGGEHLNAKHTRSNMTDIASFDFRETIQNRIKDEFMSLVPDEAWDEMVKKVVQLSLIHI